MNTEDRVLSDLESEFEETMDELRISEEIKESARNFLGILCSKSKYTYAHSLRVGLLARRIARFMHLDEKALFFAGIFHDLGKSQVPLSTLHKTSGWNEEDAKIIESHVMDGYRLLRDKFNFSAEIILWHHKFQENAYPVELPPPLREYPQGVKILIQEYGRILAIADVYDALYRKNNKSEEGEELTGEEIRERMLELNGDRKELIVELYNVGILERDVIATDTPDKELYEQAWGRSGRNPQETARLVVLAASLEPIADKAGCTTRFTDISRHLKLEYFVTGAINIGDAFERLAKRVDLARQVKEWASSRSGMLPNLYELAILAQKESLKNRSGGRINQGIIELLLPIVAAQHYFDPAGDLLNTEQTINSVRSILVSTDRSDVEALVNMKKFAHHLCRYNERQVPTFPDATNVYEYYEWDLATSTTPTGLAHNGEFVNGFPTVKLLYDSIMNSSKRSFIRKVEEAFRHGVKFHHKDVGRGFLADCIATAVYLCLSQHPKIQLVV